MMSETFERIRSLLDSAGADYETVHHAPTRTSKESARARGEKLSVGGKALVLKVDKSFMLFVLSAAKRLDSIKIKRRFDAKRIRFASASELLELTGLVPGSVPPIGRPLYDIDLYVDRSVILNERIAFNAGSLTESVIMAVSDYLEIARPVIFDFSE
jgi:Ala-tRNA(Pro) deacylase